MFYDHGLLTDTDNKVIDAFALVRDKVEEIIVTHHKFEQYDGCSCKNIEALNNLLALLYGVFANKAVAQKYILNEEELKSKFDYETIKCIFGKEGIDIESIMEVLFTPPEEVDTIDVTSILNAVGTTSCYTNITPDEDEPTFEELICN